MMRIELDDLSRQPVTALLEEHLRNMYELSLPDQVFAFNASKLKAPDISFWTAWDGEVLLGCAALKELSSTQGEIKSCALRARCADGCGSSTSETRHRRRSRSVISGSVSRNGPPRRVLTGPDPLRQRRVQALRAVPGLPRKREQCLHVALPRTKCKLRFTAPTLVAAHDGRDSDEQ